MHFCSTYPCNGMSTLRFRLLKWEAANAGIVTIKLLRAHLLRPVRRSPLCSNCVCKPESCFPPSRTWTAAWCGHWQWLICLVNHGETCIPSLWKLGRISNAHAVRPRTMPAEPRWAFWRNVKDPFKSFTSFYRLLLSCLLLSYPTVTS